MKPPEQYACLRVRDFPAQAALRLRPELRERPCVVLEGEPPLQAVCSLNTKARLLGVQCGMTKVEVETFGGISCIARSSSAETAARTALMECAASFSPRVEAPQQTRELLCCLDVAGTESLFGAAEQLAKSIRRRAASLGLSIQAAVSSNFHTSILIARGLSPTLGVCVVRAGEEASSLAPLPLSVLDLSESFADIFSAWGIRTLGMLASLPQTQLLARLGQEGRRLQQMAAGTLPHLFQPVDIPFVLEEQIELDHPLDNLESLLFGVAIMLDHLIVRASLHVYELASVAVELALEGGATHRLTVSPRVPTNDKHLWVKLLRLELEARPAQAPILSVRLHAEPGSRSKVQLGLFSPQLPEPGRLDLSLARIAAVVGEHNVGHAVLDDTHAQDGFHIEPFAVPSRESFSATSPCPKICMRRIHPPAETSIELAAGKPSSFSFQNRSYRVEHAYGPWLLGGAWWSERLWGQEQWDLVARGNDGSLLYCCVLRDFVRARWHIAGLYD